MSLNSPISELKGVGDELAEKLGLLGVKTIGDLIENYPRRYVDYSNVVPLEQIRPGVVSIRAKISQVKGRYVRRGMHITEAIASDETGSVRLVWFNQPYREVRGLKSFQIRKLVRSAADIVKDMPEHLPSWLLEQEKLIDYKTAALQMHFPSSAEDLEKAQRRLGFEEVFQLSLAALLNKSELYKDKSIAIPFKEQLAKEFVSKLPFKLTDAQRRAVWKIYQDMDKTQPMNRLLEGDVGSGKTVVAAMAALMAMEQGFQAALMAPTEILARQHADTLYKLLETVVYDGQVGLLIGGLKPKEKQLARDKIASGDIKFIVGTHALISERVDMHKLGLVIIDEQHRFGVAQRKKLQAKAA